MSEYFTLVPKETYQNSNRQEPVGSISDRPTIILNQICHTHNQNNIVAPFISNTHETDITQKCNILYQKYVDIIKIHRHQNTMQISLWIVIQLS